MMKYFKRSKAFFLLFLVLFVKNVDCIAQKDPVLEITLHTNKTFQTIHNFGASDAWSIQAVGKYWSEDVKNKIASLLFSTSNKPDGSPEGIGLTAWRFNIGAGSTEQGEDSQILTDWRKSESFLNADGTYNWNKQSGELWFLNEAKKRGVRTFVGFVNSPPVFYTKNGKTFSDDGLSANIKSENYKKFADFLSEVVKGVKSKTGVDFDYISPFNEPQWDWKCCKQEGSPWNNDEIVEATKAIDASFNTHNISAKIEITEAGHLDFLYSEKNRPNRGNQIAYFFDKNSPGYIGDLKSIAKKIAGHSYFSTWDLETLKNTRHLLSKEIQKVDPSLEFWMSEYCILEDNEIIKGGGRDLGIDPALYIARVIHSDLVLANASAWHWWLAVSPYDFKDGLIYIDDNKLGGNYYESKMLWALGHYSRFIRPEMKRIHTSRSDKKSPEEALEGVLQSAYMNEDEIVLVLVNQFKVSKDIKISGIPKEFKTMEVYQTTDVSDINLKKVSTLGIDEVITLPKKSLTTCVLKR
ncbi:glycoside hydrolase [Confluentibacter citreus]|uniref:glycoside hydrolase n=1 Tax=Confluentibacter citreus TaxID=2007307 RepID=UPI001EFD7BD9|nr:glycoside hydrolase [Confluentibacter citreus]